MLPMPVGFFGIPLPIDHYGAWAFREATKDYSLEELAYAMQVGVTQIERWRQKGNVPPRRDEDIPDEAPHFARRRYAELMAKRRNVIVVERDMLVSLFELIGWRPATAKASLGAAEPASFAEQKARVVGA